MEKKISTAGQLTDIIRVFLSHQVGPLDCVALSNAYDFAESDFGKILEIDELVYSMKTIKEIRDSSTRSGIQTLKCIINIQDSDEVLNLYDKSLGLKNAYGTYPVVLAISCKALGISKEKCMAVLLYGFVTSVVGSALRLGMIQHFEGQEIIHNLRPAINDTINQNINKTYSEMWQFAPQVDVFQMSHEAMNSKMFIT